MIKKLYATSSTSVTKHSSTDENGEKGEDLGSLRHNSGEVGNRATVAIISGGDDDSDSEDQDKRPLENIARLVNPKY